MKAMMVVGIALPVILLVYMCAVNWIIFRKAGRAGWKALVPVYNIYVMFDIAYGSGIRMLLMLIPVAGLFFSCKFSYDIARKFGCSKAMGILNIFFPVVIMSIMAFSKNIQYEGAMPETAMSEASMSGASGASGRNPEAAEQFEEEYEDDDDDGYEDSYDDYIDTGKRGVRRFTKLDIIMYASGALTVLFVIISGVRIGMFVTGNDAAAQVQVPESEEEEVEVAEDDLATEVKEDEEEVSQDLPEETPMKSMTEDEALLKLVKDAIVVGTYKTSDGKGFQFSSDGAYHGYLDEETTNTAGSYELSGTTGSYIVTIKADGKEVKYICVADTVANNLLLKDMQGNLVFTLIPQT